MSRRRRSSSTGWDPNDSRYGPLSIEELEATLKYRQAVVDQMVKEGKDPKSPIDYVHLVEVAREELEEAKKKQQEKKGGRYRKLTRRRVLLKKLTKRRKHRK